MAVTDGQINVFKLYLQAVEQKTVVWSSYIFNIFWLIK